MQNSASARRWLATAALALYAPVQLAAALGDGVSQPMRVVGVAFGVALGICAIGVARRMLWARWIALGAAVVGVSNVAVLAQRYDLPQEVKL